VNAALVSTPAAGLFVASFTLCLLFRFVRSRVFCKSARGTFFGHRRCIVFVILVLRLDPKCPQSTDQRDQQRSCLRASLDRCSSGVF
jgi:hypothetical protein